MSTSIWLIVAFAALAIVALIAFPLMRLHRRRRAAARPDAVGEAAIAAALHELKAPLSRMQFALASVRRAQSESSGALDAIESDIARIEKTVRDFSDLASLDAPDALPDEPYPLADTLTRLAERNRPLADSYGVQLDVEPVAGVIDLPSEFVERALEHLLVNAILYAGDNAQAQLFAFCDEQQCRVGVRDSGPGMSDKELSKIAMPFVRGERARQSDRDGSGLGLAFASRVASRIGGELILENRAEGGLLAALQWPKK